MKQFLLLSLSLTLVGGALTSEAAAPQEKGDAPKNKGEVVTLDGLKSRVAATWQKQEPDNKLRVAQFRIPKVEGDPKDAELVIFHFGAGGGGDVQANLDRWKAKFRAPKDKSIDEVTKVEKFKVGKVPVTYLDVSGTYLYKFPPFAPNAKTTPLPDYRMFGVIFASENGPYFITLIGPARTVAQNKQGFEEWIKGFK